MPSQDRSIERVRDLDRLMVRVSGILMAIALGFAPSWIDRLEKIRSTSPTVAEILIAPIFVVYGLFMFAFVISFLCFFGAMVSGQPQTELAA